MVSDFLIKSPFQEAQSHYFQSFDRITSISILLPILSLPPVCPAFFSYLFFQNTNQAPPLPLNFRQHFSSCLCPPPPIDITVLCVFLMPKVCVHLRFRHVQAYLIRYLWVICVSCVSTRKAYTRSSWEKKMTETAWDLLQIWIFTPDQMDHWTWRKELKELSRWILHLMLLCWDFHQLFFY